MLCRGIVKKEKIIEVPLWIIALQVYEIMTKYNILEKLCAGYKKVNLNFEHELYFSAVALLLLFNNTDARSYFKELVDELEELGFSSAQMKEMMDKLIERVKNTPSC